MKFKTLFVYIIFSLLFAILLAVYAQAIASFFPKDWYMVILIATTIISICLFIIAAGIEFTILISDKITSRLFSVILTIVLLMTVTVGLFISWWSLFVVAMSWG